MRLIDADALRNGVREAAYEGDVTPRDVLTMIDLWPTIEAEPVRHGRWDRDPTDENYFICSVCGGFNGTWNKEADCTHKFCPWCGAKMDEKEATT